MKILIHIAMVIFLGFFVREVFAFDVQVKTKYGVVEGIVSKEEEVLSWKGIPYARPPLKNLRWKSPREPVSWAGVLQAKNYREPCFQHESNAEWKILDSFVGSEDCLYLNIWRPDTEEKNLPVFYFIHGGGNYVGNAFYDSSILARKMNVVAVTVGYRLGPLGFFSHQSLKNRGSLDSTGNYGLLDLMAGLKWVGGNIREFGGNPDNITIAGQSAGAGNVLALMGSPLASGLFHKAIVQSVGEGVEPDEVAQERSRKMIDSLQAGGNGYSEKAEDTSKYLKVNTELKKLYQLSAKEMLQAFNGETHDHRVVDVKHIIDGEVVLGSYPEIFSMGSYNKVPIIIGCNQRELGSLLLLFQSKTPDDPRFSDLFSVLHGEKNIQSVLKNNKEKSIFELSQILGSELYLAMTHVLSETLKWTPKTGQSHKWTHCAILTPQRSHNHETQKT